ncbi:hypothetical protein MMC20_002004 [Loxospora ochrophaea]|nr:hypothetical protein [Loxospora ochrophaea]
MDEPSSSRSTPKVSGIPRLSKPPVIQPSSPLKTDRVRIREPPRVNVRPGYSTLPARSSLSRRQNIASYHYPQKSDGAAFTSIQKDRNEAEKSSSNTDEAVTQSTSQSEQRPLKNDEEDQSPFARSDSNAQSNRAVEATRNRDILEMKASKDRSKSRPSLSDRTIETLSQIPPSPSPRRRRSSFFLTESPMRPPSRPASAMNHSRPGSRSSQYRAMGTLPKRPISPYKKQSPLQKPVTTPKMRAASQVPKFSPSNYTSTRNVSQSTPTSPNAPRSNGNPPMSGTKGRTIQENRKGSQSYAIRSTNPKSAPNPMKPESLRASRNNTDKERCENTISPASGAAVPGDVQGGKYVSKSSATLREAISKAKAARRAVTKSNSESSNVPRSVLEDDFLELRPQVDPFTLNVVDGNNNAVLRQRINTARTSGQLNIAALGLTEIPKEVVEMYDSSSLEAGDSAWYESVDLVRLVAADNEIEELTDQNFPDVDIETLKEEPQVNTFRGLETLDLHGNRLWRLPSGLRKLERLTVLNLSRNNLPSECFEVIYQISTLRDLRIAENHLQHLPTRLCHLVNLETLDVQKNSITRIPDSIGDLSRLRTLNVSGNKLSSLPFEFLLRAPLVDLNASANRLSGSLVASNVRELLFLQHLDVSNNALQCLVERDKIDMPCLQTLDISNNGIKNLPNIAGCGDLQSIVAPDNQISSIPAGFASLGKLKIADFTGNTISRLDNQIGFMECLIMLRVANNPLQERRLLAKTTEDLKSDLRSRLEAPEPSETSEFQSNSRHGLLLVSDAVGSGLEPSTAWTVKAGVLDRSSKKLQTIEDSDIEPVAVNSEVKSLFLHHNSLESFSRSTRFLGSTLSNLDLSHNRIGQNIRTLLEPLELPYLQYLDLTSNNLSSLESLIAYLSAPSLSTIVLSQNRLTQIPHFQSSFPKLTKLVASDNVITNVDVDAVLGLHFLDIRNNDIRHLPPRLGLLQGQLKVLIASGNKFRVPDWRILQKGTEEVLEWLRRKIPEGEEVEGVESLD